MDELTRILFIPDTHVPYHNKKAFDLMLHVCDTFKPQTIIILGDFADCYSVSKFSKDPARKLHFQWEINEVCATLDKLDALGATQKVYIAGNHEFRLDRFIQDKAPELWGILDIPTAFSLKSRKWIYIPYRKDFKLGKVYLTHDVDCVGRNAAHKVIDTYLHSAITGHTHRLTYVVESDGIGNPILSATFGWLGDTSKIDYQHRIKAIKNYVLGFGIGYMEKSTGIVYAVPVPIIKNRCLINGKIYKLP
jgi:predicted phosphodiesterase